MNQLVKVEGARAIYVSGTFIIQETIEPEALQVLEYYKKLPANQI